MKLIYAKGTCAFAVHLLLEELGKNYETMQVKLHEKDSILEKYNPKNYVPALVLNDGKVLTEGISILEYLADSNARYDLLPEAGTINRARCSEWLAYLSSEIHKGFGPLFQRDKLGQEYLKSVTDKLSLRLRFIDDSLKGKKFLMGEDFTVADMYALALFRIADHIKVDFTPYKNLNAYWQNLEAMPLVKKVTESEMHEHLTKAA